MSGTKRKSARKGQCGGFIWKASLNPGTKENPLNSSAKK